jgi:hypothetical protein
MLQKFKEHELSKGEEARAICHLLQIDCRGNKELEKMAERRAETLAELLRLYVDQKLASI